MTEELVKWEMENVHRNHQLNQDNIVNVAMICMAEDVLRVEHFPQLIVGSVIVGKFKYLFLVVFNQND